MEIHQPSGRWQLGLGLSLLTVCLWGLLPIALKIMLKEMDAYTICWYRFLTSASLLGLYLAARKQLPDLRHHRSNVYGLLVLVILGLAGNYILIAGSFLYLAYFNRRLIVD